MLLHPVPIRFWKLRGGIGIQTVESSVDLDLFKIQTVFVFHARRQFVSHKQVVFLFVQVVPHEAVAEVSRIGNL